MKHIFFGVICLFFASSVSGVQRPDGFISLNECVLQGCPVTYLLEENGLKQFVLTLNNAQVVGEGAIVTAGGKILTDTTTYNLDQQNILKEGRDILQEEISFYDGTLAVISSPGQQNYYHWLIQILPRIKILEESKIPYDKLYVLADSFGYAWQKETLFRVMDYFGIARDRLLLATTHIEAKKLLVPSIPWNPASTVFWDYPFMTWYIDFFKNIFLKPQSKPMPKRIFISRAKASYRRISNEDALTQLLSKKGFVSVRLEDHSVFEQAALFNNAEIIIGPHGAGWTNLLFCKPETLMIEIDHGIYAEEQRSVFKGMAGRLKCMYRPYYADMLPEPGKHNDIYAPINQDIYVDINAFEQFCERLDI